MATKLRLWILPASLFITSFAHAQATAPTSQTLQATVTELIGSAQARKSENDPWQQVKVGMLLPEGAEIRSNFHTKVVCHIPPDQDIIVDRGSYAKILIAKRAGNEVQTKIGMPYGRTQYQVEQSGVQHNAEITSPGATLAVRGTKDMMLYDQGPFTPIAYASQPVKMRNARGQTIAFGKAGSRAKLAADKNSPGEQSLVETHVDPAGQFAGRTADENKVLSYLARVAPGFDLSQYRLLSLIADPNFKGTAAAVLPIQGQLQFTMFWQDIINSDLDLAVISPKGERVDFTHQKVASSGHYLGQGTDKSGKGVNGVGDKSGFGQEAIIWETSYPFGTYTIETTNKSSKGSSVTAQIFVIQDPLTKGTVVGNFTDTVTKKAPSINTVTINPPAKGGGSTPPAATARRK